VRAQVDFSNTRLTGGPALWGDVHHPRDEVDVVRCCPFTCAKFHGGNPVPVVAFVPYAPLGAGGPGMPSARPTLEQVRPEAMLQGAGDSGVCFGRVLLFFQACVLVKGKATARIQELAYIQPFGRYVPDGVEPSPAVSSSCVESDTNVHLYEPIVRPGHALHRDTAPVVVPIRRILCQVPVLPDVASSGRIPPGTNVASLPGAVAADPQRRVAGSRLCYLSAMQLRWSRSKVLHFDPGLPGGVH